MPLLSVSELARMSHLYPTPHLYELFYDYHVLPHIRFHWLDSSGEILSFYKMTKMSQGDTGCFCPAGSDSGNLIGGSLRRKDTLLWPYASRGQKSPLEHLLYYVPFSSSHRCSHFFHRLFVCFFVWIFWGFGLVCVYVCVCIQRHEILIPSCAP